MMDSLACTASGVTCGKCLLTAGSFHIARRPQGALDACDEVLLLRTLVEHGAVVGEAAVKIQPILWQHVWTAAGTASCQEASASVAISSLLAHSCVHATNVEF